MILRKVLLEKLLIRLDQYFGVGVRSFICQPLIQLMLHTFSRQHGLGGIITGGTLTGSKQVIQMILTIM